MLYFSISVLDVFEFSGVVSALEGRLKQETLIGKGFVSDVFSWGAGRVLKLYHPSYSAEVAQRELAITRAVHAAGIAVPAAHEVIEIAGRHGVVLDHVRGHSLVQEVEKKPWRLFAAARQLADLHAQLHAHVAPTDLPSQREQIARWIDPAADGSGNETEKARRHLAELSDSDCLCHGDFHPANILLTARGPVLIDWSTGTRGHALADVARTSVLIESANLPDDASLHLRAMMKLARRALHATYLKRYLELRPGTLDEIEFWRVPQRMAFAARRAEILDRQRSPV